MRKNTLKALSLMCTALMSMSCVVGCSGGTNDSQKPAGATEETTLDIYILNTGFGYQWLNDSIELFKQQDWVKEKYPNLYIPDIEFNSNYTYGTDMIKAGKKANKFDLIIGADGAGLRGVKDTSGALYLETLNDVFDSTVPGEDILYKDKMFDQYENVLDYNGTYWYSAYVANYMGFLYNADLFDALGLSVPRTTDELIALCKQVSDLNGSNSKYDKNYSIMYSTSRDAAMYWHDIAFNQFWCQYEGVEEYYNFFKGIDTVTETKNTKEVLRQQGRLEAMEVCYTLLHDYSFEGAGSIDFVEAQTRFLMGDGLIVANGDWLYEEMKTTVAGLKDRGIDYDIRFMKMPIVSAITDKLTTVKTDAQLAALVDAIDNGETSMEGVSAEDFARVKEARNFMYTSGYGGACCVPAYASGKEVAKDFLRFLATDQAINQYMKTTRGATSPFTYDVETKDPATYAAFDNIQKQKQAMFTSEDTQFLLPTNYKDFPLVYRGGFVSCPVGYIDVVFSKNGGKTAQEYFNDQIDYYTDAKWQDILRNSGV